MRTTHIRTSGPRQLSVVRKHSNGDLAVLIVRTAGEANKAVWLSEKQIGPLVQALVTAERELRKERIYRENHKRKP